MVEIEFKMELSDYRQLLSDWLRKEAKHIFHLLGRLSIHLFVFVKNHYHFLRHFNYTKKNITGHLMQKAAHFFGMELDENAEKTQRKNKPFSSKFRLKDKRSALKKEIAFTKLPFNGRKKVKNNQFNFYRAPE